MNNKFILSLNTGMFVNRFTDYDKFSNFISRTLKLKYIQLTADFLMLNMDDINSYKHAEKLFKSLQKNKIQVNSTFTGAFSRLNHLSHPDKYHQEFWIKWFKRFFKISKNMGANYSGSHLGIVGIDQVKEINKILKSRLVKNWEILGEYAYKINLDGIIWEPMSIDREYGHTLSSTRKINRILNLNSKTPFMLCLDVAHGDDDSKNPDDTNPYKWIDRFANQSPVIHLKQKIKRNYGHLPFTKKNNKYGIINNERVINHLSKSNLKKHELVLELSFKERSIVEKKMKSDIIDSIQYWQNSIK